MRPSVRWAAALVLGMSWLSGGCGGKGGGEEAAQAAGKAGAIEPCALLSAEQVATVIPGQTEGYVANAGGSLIAGVDSYQCSYSDPANNLLTVIVTVAVDDARFAQISPSSSRHEDHQAIAAGDRGWVWGEDADWKVQVLKGRSLIDLELMAPDARQKSEALVALARAIAQRL